MLTALHTHAGADDIHELWMQVLHYSVDGMQEKLQYLREIGMEPEQVAHSIVRLPQLLSLDVRHNMRPKYNYLQSQMGGNVQTLCTYPAYFSLSLLQRYNYFPSHTYRLCFTNLKFGFASVHGVTPGAASEFGQSLFPTWCYNRWPAFVPAG